MIVSLFQDVEDPINPLADDAALDLARLFTEAGVRGSFCVTGEKCRKLIERGRRDVIEALSVHCLGLHTDTHSYHPTTMELLADVDFDTGSELAYETELRGCLAFTRAFDRAPAFWGGAGNTWAPEITDALRRLEIPAYVYALTEVPGQVPHHFNGVMAFSQQLSVSEAEWAGEVDAGEVFARYKGPHLSLFTGHPTRFRYDRFWDVPYALGETPAKPALATAVPEEIYERSKRNLLRFLKDFSQAAQVVGLDEAIELPWTSRPPQAEEVTYFEERTAQNLRGAVHWPIHRPGLSAERIIEKTLALSETLEICGI